MASADLTVRTLPTAPSLSATDRAAESWLSTAGREALRRATTATRRIRDDEFTAALNARGLNEYNDYVAASAA